MVMKTAGLRLNIKKPDVEFWLIERSEGLSFFAVRVSGLAKENKFRQSGELKKEIAELLCLESRPAPTDIVLDPFCGGGAIIRERCSYFPYQKAIAYDLDSACVERTKTTLADKKNVEVTKIDFFKNSLTSGSIDKIVTDPPWGLYQGLTEADNFFSKIVQETERLLKNGGVAVFLIGGDKTKFEKAVESSKLSLKRQTNILVSGKKASIYRYQKNV
jgi:tRNA G10  N-methylase Trm11